MRSNNIKYYVGIGASAGGLEALEAFFSNMPPESGLAFFVVQHLSPDYKSMMDELLARHTNMDIKIAQENMSISPNTIYLIPPRKIMTLSNDHIHLEEKVDRHKLNLPIDIFLRSLADDVEKDAIAVILSGTGSDGTLGIRAIKERGGMVIVQDDKSAKFDGMPRSSIATGLADYIIPPEKMPEALLEYIRHPYIDTESVIQQGIDPLLKISVTLKDYCGIDFSYYKENTVLRRIERRVKINRFSGIEEYLNLLKNSDLEKDQLSRELLIGVTRFFRDEEAYQSLTERVIPKIIKPDQEIRIWSAGCSTGEEVYSIAIIIQDYMAKNNINCDVKIFATDIDGDAISTASTGFYTESIVSDVEPELLKKYFVSKEGGYQISETIRGMVVFARHNILEDPPFSKLDLLVCRNLFIYIKPEIQQKIFNTFFYALKENGYLMIGSSESLGETGDLFYNIDSKWKIYKPKENKRPSISSSFPIPRRKNYEERSVGNMNHLTNAYRMEKLLTEITSAMLPPTIVIDENYHIVQVLNDIGRIIQIKPGRFSNDIFANINSDLTAFVSSILRRLKSEESVFITENIRGIKGFENQTLQIEGRTIVVDRVTMYMLSFSFHENKDNIEITEMQLDIDSEALGQIQRLEEELQLTKESLQATVEELETSNEELQSSNEELIASNEELQSTNEELQSVNEELYSVNSEHQSKIQQLTELNNDLSNLMKNTGVGALYLDRKLCIRKLTPVVSQITNLLPSDIGRPIDHMTVVKGYDNILEDIENVVETLQGIDREIQDHKGVYWMVRIRPYRTEYNAVDGIILTFIEFDALKHEQIKLEKVTERLNNVMDMGNLAWWEWDVKTGLVECDPKKATMIGYSLEEFPQDVYEICDLIHPEDYEKTMQIMKDHLEGHTESWDATYRIRRKNGKYSWYYDRGRVTHRSSDGSPLRVAGSVLKISQVKKEEFNIDLNSHLIESLLGICNSAAIIIDPYGRILKANDQATSLLQLQKLPLVDHHIDFDKNKVIQSSTQVTSSPLEASEVQVNINLPSENKPSESLVLHFQPIYSHDGLYSGFLGRIL